MGTLLIRNGLILTLNKKGDIFKGDILVKDKKIQKVARVIRPGPRVPVLDATDQFVLPGLIQAHTHLVQTLFRGEADDLPLLDWLRKKVWPLEAAHNKNSIRASVQLGVLELLKNGTTSILDMATVKHTQTLLEEVSQTGLRYWGGKCLMDRKKYSGPLYESTAPSLGETEELILKLDHGFRSNFHNTCSMSLGGSPPCSSMTVASLKIEATESNWLFSLE